MIDDLHDTYVDAYPEPHKNDWGYLTTQPNSSYSFLKNKLLNHFPNIKTTFFTPYLEHALCHPNGKYAFKTHAIIQRDEFKKFLTFLVDDGHELAHHGSNHGHYKQRKPIDTRYFIHELTTSNLHIHVKKIIDTGYTFFKKACNYTLHGGKYCLPEIEKSSLLYWCCQVTYFQPAFHFYKNILKFPTTIPGNLFIKYTYLTTRLKKDSVKILFGWLTQPTANYFLRKIRNKYK